MILSTDGKTAFVVVDVQVYAGYVLHTGYLKYGSLSLDSEVECVYDELRRWPMRNNHTATHILNFALESVFEGHVDQKGSLVVPEKLRFDYSAKAAPKFEQMERIEGICNEFIAKNSPVYTREVPLKIAKSIFGLRAVFGEVYPDPVRVVSVGFSLDDILADPGNEKWATSSIEFCGGTYVSQFYN
jgi:alanyl-tRNA synthetase